jgi:hypothetical protein
MQLPDGMVELLVDAIDQAEATEHGERRGAQRAQRGARVRNGDAERHLDVTDVHGTGLDVQHERRRTDERRERIGIRDDDRTDDDRARSPRRPRPTTWRHRAGEHHGLDALAVRQRGVLRGQYGSFG